MAQLTWQAWLEQFGCNAQHAYFVSGWNPDGSGGGVIRSSDSWRDAWDTMQEAARRSFRDVQVQRADEFWKEAA